MGFRFRRTLKIAPGLHINLSKSGPSLSVGPHGARYTIGPRGDRATVGIPGTGLSYTSTGSHCRDGGAAGSDGDESAATMEDGQEVSLPAPHQPSPAETFLGYGLGLLLAGLGLCLVAVAIIIVVAGLRWILA